MKAPPASGANIAYVSLRSLFALLAEGLSLSFLAFSGAAAAQVGSHQEVIVRDSAGITIIENADSMWTTGTAWTVPDSPALQIGSLTGEDGPVFGKVGDAARLSNGRFVVTDPMVRQVVFLNQGGRFLALAGGKGEGPSEFRNMGPLWVLHCDTLAVTDQLAGKIVCFDGSGNHSRTIPAPIPLWRGHLAPSTVGVLPDGSFFIAPYPQKGEYAPGRGITEAPLYYFDRDGELQGIVDSLPALETVNEGGTLDAVVLGPNRRFSADETGVWYGFSATYELRHITPTGVDRIIRRSPQREAVSREVRDRWREWRRSAFDESVPGFVWETLEREPIADSLPVFEQVQVSKDGYLWVEEPYALSEETPETWSSTIPPGRRPWAVFDPNGVWLGTVQMPAGIKIVEIGPDYVLGVWRDELDVSYVRFYRIRKPS
jgi:hypothetical protein